MCCQRCDYLVTFIFLQLLFVSISCINSQEYGNLPENHLKFFGQHSSKVQHCDAKNKDCSVRISIVCLVSVKFFLLLASVFSHFEQFSIISITVTNIMVTIFV